MNRFFFHFHLLRTKKRAWFFSSLFAFYILAQAPFIPTVSLWLRHHNLLRVSLLVLLFLFLGYLLAYFFSALNITKVRAYFGIAFLLGISLLFFMIQKRSIEERIHIMEFAFLTLLFFKAAKFSFQGFLIYAIPLLLAITIGWLDEIWQAILPNRIYDIQDVCDNAFGSLVGIGFAWIRQKYGKEINLNESHS